ncbi:hypothetical protein SDC9_142647 [bioreactor metagenome]|uniref:N-acetyltransferase domain-containing protein n=1 Tax=bioreactor metagenome TaxID=1076179 RepID=A0A645E3W2_9ZZZZ|nr:GNAT family N-acetyltransferase [Oscillospiraceae bacterium]
MNISYKIFTPECCNAVIDLQHNWVKENITFGVVCDNEDDILKHQNDYFILAFDFEKLVGYITADVITNSGERYINIFDYNSDYLCVNDLYIHPECRNRRIGENLLALVEKKAVSNNINNYFVSSATKDAGAVRNFYERNGYTIWTTLFYKKEDHKH